MRIYKYIFLCALCILLAACGGGIDVGPPGPLTVTLDTVSPSNGAIDLAWTSDGTDFTVVRDGEDLTSLTDFIYQDDSTINGTRYCYQIRATNFAGAVVTSNTECATSMADVSLAITNQSLSAILNWTESLGASSYHIYVGDPVPSASLSKEVNKAIGDPPIVVAGPPYTLTDLSNCSDYPVKVVPVDIDGNESVSEVAYIDAVPTTGGFLDVTFGTNGVVVEGIVGQFLDVKLLSDGRIAAIYNDALDSRLFIYNSDGSPNDEIDLSGNPNIDMSRASDLVIDENDNIFVAGRDDDMRVCKLDSEGVLDTTFGQPANPGCYYLGAPPSSRANEIVIHPSGDLLLVGSQSVGGDPAFKILRLTSDGALVWEYTYSVPGDEYQGEAITVQGDRIVAAGFDDTLALDRLMVVSINFAGADEIVSFYVAPGDITTGYGIAPAPDGSVIITGQTLIGGTQLYLPIWNYPTDLSSVDLFTYTLTTGVGLGSNGFDIQYDCRDRIVSTGVDVDAAGGTIVMRTDDAFNIDTTFGNIDPLNGWFLYNAGVAQLGSAMTQDDLGRIYVVGIENDGANDHPILMRLQ